MLIAGGQYPKGGRNKKLMLLNLQDKTLRTLEPLTSQDELWQVPRIRAQLYLDGLIQDSSSTNVSLQGGISLINGQVLADHYSIEIDLDNLKYKSVNVTRKHNENQMIDKTFITYLTSSSKKANVALQINKNKS